MIKSSDTKRLKNIVEKKFASKQLSASVLNGPYEINVGYEVIAKNKKMIYRGSSNLPTGVYFADIRRFMANIEIPTNAVGRIISVEREAYSDPYNQSVLGFNQPTTHENGKTYLVGTTYTLFVNYGMYGGYIGAHLPQNTGTIKKFTYEYWTF